LMKLLDENYFTTHAYTNLWSPRHLK